MSERITVKIENGVPMGREKQPFANALVRIGAALEHEAPGMTEWEWEAELIDQWAHKSTPNVWIDEKGSKAVTDALGLHKRQIWVLSQKVEVKEVELPTIIQSALLHEIPTISKRTGISEVWLAVWHEVEIFYGDVQKKETREELLLRLQNQYSLNFKSPPTN